MVEGCGGPRWPRRVRGEEEGVARGRVKGRPQGLWVGFYKVRRGGEPRPCSNGHQWPWRASALIAIKEEGTLI
jgi:hypothetical protein